MPRVLVVEHEATCPPALFGSWLEDAGCEVVVCRPYAGDPLPTLAEYDALLVLGGSMAATDDPRLAGAAARPGARRRRRRGAHARDLPGPPGLRGRVRRHRRAATRAASSSGCSTSAGRPRRPPTRCSDRSSTPRRAVQWNDDLVIRLPDDAVALAVTPHGEIQAARFAPTVWGVQWHPEVDRAVLDVWAHDDEERHAAAGIDQERLLADIGAAHAELERSWRPLAEGLAALAGVPARSRG